MHFTLQPHTTIRRGNQAALDRAIAAAQSCRRCPAMEGRRRLLSSANGPAGAAVLFVAEAPGRLGGERSGIPLTGDRTGRAFRALLRASGLRDDEVFITNAVLCNPCHDGKNRPPTATEIANCRDHLERTIDAVDPLVVVALGAVALRALAALAPHGATLRTVGIPVAWHNRWLVPLYHPGPRAQLRRTFDQQRKDIVILGSLLRSERTPLSVPPNHRAQKNTGDPPLPAREDPSIRTDQPLG